MVVCRDITERRRTGQQLSLVQTISLEVAVAGDLSEAMEVVLRRVCEITGWDFGQAWLPRADGTALALGPSWLQADDARDLEQFRGVSARSEFLTGQGLPGRVWASKKPAWVQDVTFDRNFRRTRAAAAAGLKAAVAIPILSGDEVIAVIEFFLRERRAQDDQLVKVITAAAAQLSMVIDRKRAEDALRESEARFRVIADHAPVLLWMSGPDKRCTFFNRGWLQFTGRSMDEEVGDGWMHGIHPGDVERHQEIYTRSFDARQEFTTEYRLRRWDGEHRWILDCGIPRFGSGNELLGYIGSCVDITDRRRAEEADQRLAQASRLTVMGELTASIAHEIKQPLAAIALMADACERWLAGPAPSLDEARECLAGISASTARVHEVMGRVRTLTKKAAVNTAPVQINEVIEEALNLARHELLARQTMVRMELSPTLPVVIADRIQLQQVLLNLVINAVQAMTAVPPDERRLVIQCSLKNDAVVVEVQDSGPGLPSEVEAKLFTPFFTTKAEGLGLGLSIAQSIIEAHGGRIGTVPRAGGATFRFELPAAAAVLRMTDQPAVALRRGRRSVCTRGTEQAAALNGTAGPDLLVGAGIPGGEPAGLAVLSRPRRPNAGPQRPRPAARTRRRSHSDADHLYDRSRRTFQCRQGQ